MTKYKNPLVSIVMPAYNAGDFLRESVDSILNQSYRNLEFIVVDDASTDDTSKILNYYKKLDKRIKVITNKINLGVSASANIAIKDAKGEFIARMDADDISLPQRIEKQLNFLTKNKKIVAVGGQCELIDKNGIKMGEKVFPTDFTDIRNMIFSNVPLQQPTLMVNKNLLPKNFVWYDNEFSSAEELELIFKLFTLGKVRNLRNVVLKYRIHDNNISFINPKKTFYLTLKTRIKGLVKYGYVPSFLGILITLVQVFFVSLMPSRLIYPTYMYLRGMRKINLSSVRIKLYVPNFFKKAYQLATG